MAAANGPKALPAPADAGGADAQAAGGDGKAPAREGQDNAAGLSS